MQTIYSRTFTAVGEEARGGFEDGFLILFAADEAADDMADYCFLHEGTPLAGSIAAGDVFGFGSRRYTVTAVGSNAEDNLRDLGHITLYFDSAEEAKLPGTVHLQGQLPADELKTGTAFFIEK